MAEDDHEAARTRDAERLRELEARLDARSTQNQASRGEEHFSQANIAWRMVTELVAGLGLGFGIGYGLDYLTGLQPVFMVVFVLLGLVAGIRTMMRTASEIGRTPGAPGDDKGE
ncbi:MULTISPECIES: AtpZ/AtpI family protein [unclassified Paracoccus (in: a-proteobacteria)]|uniref:AtpZ/AtpI family protein n=1 Tax=unclassified Paracoccus (in: a-proteobacteria) TaxID=2688777 RepID=UPI0012B2C993|nr:MULTISPECIES: AtpZ/AtpI family protein [unclassified Paracoccus (in: a-proteobacteria)]UXU74961.1 AtpZ/AtpI family protein [Paracoccus sp. SMMA_5]UXU80864.1 AtpZ/AtpI family protein [Paracoccus sp. SMMA_5_TC]